MGCTSCGSGTPSGCGSKGNCSTGGCNKKNTYDWITVLDIHDPSEFKVVEVSFKNGSRKDFYHNNEWTQATTGDEVMVETDGGLDCGMISLSGELVRLQMKKKKVRLDRVIHKVIRRAHKRDIEKLIEARELERPTLVKARVIARNLGLDMKIGDIEYQGDKRKATFYYTAEGRVDFRELVRVFAKEYRVKIEMRQIGSRQESARIGGIGSCGRELCCSTWLSDFKSVNTAAARYQNISINQTKLSGQCGRLKCCLNYELDMYLEALQEFPKTQKLHGRTGRAELLKVDIFKKLMYYSVKNENGRFLVVALKKEQVLDIKKQNDDGNREVNIFHYQVMPDVPEEKEDEVMFADVTGDIELPELQKKKKRGKSRYKKSKSRRSSKPKSGKS